MCWLHAVPQSLLARQQRHIQVSRAIHKIWDKNGKLRMSPGEINKCFDKFYQDLYKSITLSLQKVSINF